MSKLFLLLLLSGSLYSHSQEITIADFEVKHITLLFKKDTVNVIVKSKKGEELKPKPIFLFCQGSLPIPILKYDNNGPFAITPFNPDLICKGYHLVIISKPNIPLLSNISQLQNNNTYSKENGKFPKKYSDKNFLDYYVNRNKFVLEYLTNQKWVSNKKLVIAGHSEGSTIAAKLAEVYPKTTHLVYASGNPMGRIMSVINEKRSLESDSIKEAEDEIEYWKYVVDEKDNMEVSFGDTNKATYQFSNPPIYYLEKIKIPVLVSYGTKDWCTPFVDFMRVDFIRKNKTNVTFNAYIGLEHNFFPTLENNKPNYDIFNWDKVANDWLKWLK